MPNEIVLSSKGQITLPKDLRERLDLKAGDVLVWTVDDQGVTLTAKSVDFNSLRGSLGAPPKGSADLEEIDNAIVEAGGRAALPPTSQKQGEAA